MHQINSEIGRAPVASAQNWDIVRTLEHSVSD